MTVFFRGPHGTPGGRLPCIDTNNHMYHIATAHCRWERLSSEEPRSVLCAAVRALQCEQGANASPAPIANSISIMHRFDVSLGRWAAVAKATVGMRCDTESTQTNEAMSELYSSRRSPHANSEGGLGGRT